MKRRAFIFHARLAVMSTFLIAGLLLILTRFASVSYARSDRWSEPVDLSVGVRSSWFPSLTVAADGSVHAVWSGGKPIPENSGFSVGPGLARVMDLLMYAVYRDGTWSPAKDILFAGLGGFATRNSIVTGRDGRLYVAYRNGAQILFSSADPNLALQPLSWSEARRINGPGNPYYVELAVDRKGTLHVVWTEIVGSEERGQYSPCPYCANLFYRSSQDGGLTWSAPVNLADSFDGVTKPQIAVDQQNGIHVAWNIGYDNITGQGAPIAGGYRYSGDGGTTWGPVTRFTLAERGAITRPTSLPRTDAVPTKVAGAPAPGVTTIDAIARLQDAPQQTTLGLFQNRDPIVVYRSTQTDQIYYQVSRDNGMTWSNPRVIQGVRARDLRETPWDAYTMATDGSGRVHLILSGRLDTGNATVAALQKPALLHLVWNGAYWSNPSVVATNDLYPEWPRLVVSGQQLHLVWFTRSDEDIFRSDNASYRVWYSSAPIDALPSPMLPTFTPAPTNAPTPTIEPVLIATPTPLPLVIREMAPPHGPPAWERTALSVMSLALLSVIGFVAIMAVVQLRKPRRRS